MAFNIVKTNSQDDWFKFRTNGLGASEIPTLLGYSPYMSKLELFHRKIGVLYEPINSLQALYGKTTEQFSSDLYASWELNKDNTIVNYNNGIKLRECYKFPQYEYVVNDKFPYLFVSPDRGSKTSESKDLNISVEIKQTSDMVLRQYANKINPNHIIQLMVQCAVWEKPLGHLFYLIERSDIRLHEFNYDGVIIDVFTEQNLIDEVKDFWVRVLKGRAINAQIQEAKRTRDLMLVRDLIPMLEELEPESNDINTLNFEKYLTEYYYQYNDRKPIKEIEGTEEMYNIVREYNNSNISYKEAEKNKQMYKNKILDMCKGSIDFKVKFNGKEYVQVTPTSRGGVTIKTNIK